MTTLNKYLESQFLPGYWEAKEKVWKMNKKEMMDLLDSLYGFDNLPENYTDEDLRKEALEQIKRDYQTPEGKQKETDVRKLATAMFNQHKRK